MYVVQSEWAAGLDQCGDLGWFRSCRDESGQNVTPAVAMGNQPVATDQVQAINHITTAILQLVVVQHLVFRSNYVQYTYTFNCSTSFAVVAAQRSVNIVVNTRTCIALEMYQSREREGAASPGPGTYYSSQQMSMQPTFEQL